MNKKDNKRFAQVIAALSEIFDSGKETSALKVELYFKALGDLFIEEVEEGAKFLIDTRMTATMPKPAEIREVIKGRREDDAVRAWVLVDEAMRKHGSYASVNLGDPKAHRIIEMMGGWEYLGTLTEDEWKWKRKEFESLYQAITRNDGPDHVMGICEKNNAPKGYESPKLISMQNKKITKLKLIEELREVIK